MATLTINDLPVRATLERKAMAGIHGAGAPWVFGWISPFVNASPSQPQQINFYQINNYADQMINQYQTVSVNNSAPNSNLNVAVDAASVNNRLG
ncbi:MAG: hypothetical protein JWR40_2338 [Massilia sp.]|jgi:hypothetical protein|nr:hypothetical protein [Massilia sp.]MDB5950000.1 hypothetical protein [Massilia sp.]